MSKKASMSKGSKKARSAQVKTADLPVYCVYLYHFKGNALTQYEIIDCDRPFYNGNETTQELNTKLADVIQNAVKNNPHYYCKGEHMIMRRKSILAFAFESTDTATKNGRAEFLSYLGNDGGHTFSKHSDFDCTRDGRTYYVTYCLNSMKSYWGDEDLGDMQFERFHINLPFQPKSKEPGTGGTNQGPPIGPPDRGTKKKR